MTERAEQYNFMDLLFQDSKFITLMNEEFHSLSLIDSQCGGKEGVGKDEINK